MDNSHDFALAVHPNRVRVAGVLLMPLCLGHAILLTRIKSPLACYWTGDKRDVGLGDIALAVWICERPATEAHRKLGSWFTRHRVKRLARKIASAGSIDTMRGLIAYLESGFAGPKMKRQGNCTPCGSPILAMLYASLLSHFHRSDSQAFNTPISLALWNRAALLEEKGIAKVWTEEDEDFAQYARNLDPDEVEKMLGIHKDQSTQEDSEGERTVNG